MTGCISPMVPILDVQMEHLTTWTCFLTGHTLMVSPSSLIFTASKDPKMDLITVVKNNIINSSCYLLAKCLAKINNSGSLSLSAEHSHTILKFHFFLLFD